MRRLRREPGEDWDSFYRRYQRTLAKRYLIPLLSRWGVRLPGAAVLEVGCGDGGCGAALAEAGSRVTMIDTDPRLVSVARTYNEKEAIDAEVIVGDITDESGIFLTKGPFDLVMFRDVMEHLADPRAALRIARSALAASGHVFVVFPPYYSPFGAHQQLLPRRGRGFFSLNRLPYLQILPSRLFAAIAAGDGPMQEEVRRLRTIRLTMGRFERAAREAGFVITRRRTYLSRPSFALRYGAPVIPAGAVGAIPLIRELLATAAYYLVEPEDVPPLNSASASASLSGIAMCWGHRGSHRPQRVQREARCSSSTQRYDIFARGRSS